MRDRCILAYTRASTLHTSCSGRWRVSLIMSTTRRSYNDSLVDFGCDDPGNGEGHAGWQLAGCDQDQCNCSAGSRLEVVRSASFVVLFKPRNCSAHLAKRIAYCKLDARITCTLAVEGHHVVLPSKNK